MGEKYLSGNAGTGKKILENYNIFRYSLTKTEQTENELFQYDWEFGSFQKGYISIRYRNKDKKIYNGSLIGTSGDSKHKFDRDLGIYNDSSLYELFVRMLENQGIPCEGVYGDF